MATKTGASRKGLPGVKGGFAKYSGNVKSTGGKLPSGTRKTPAGGKVSSNANSTKRAKPSKMGNKG